MGSNKLSIYDDPERTHVIVHEEDKLETSVREVRHSITNYFKNNYSDSFGGLSQTFFDYEKKLFNKTASVFESSEPLLPNSIYVLLSGFAGSIIARQRSIALRASLPLLFASTTTLFLYPKTISQSSIKLYRLSVGDEKAQYPKQLDDIPKHVETIKTVLPDITTFF